jgi:uncharacterized membrane protein
VTESTPELRSRRLRRWYPALLVLVGVLVSVAVYARLPETMAVHWNAQGNPDGWMPRPFGAFFAPALMLVLWGVLRGVRHLDPRQESYARFDGAYETIVAAEESYARFDGAYETIVAAVLVLVLATHDITIAAALGYRVPIGRLLPTLVGALFVVVGNVMPRLRPNWWFGVRTPWTLSNDRVWARTHRLAGFSMAAAGVVTIVAALALPPAMGIPVMLAAVVAAVFAPAVYSYLSWRREQTG